VFASTTQTDNNNDGELLFSAWTGIFTGNIVTKTPVLVQSPLCSITVYTSYKFGPVLAQPVDISYLWHESHCTCRVFTTATCCRPILASWQLPL